MLIAEPEIAQAGVLGDGKPPISALMVVAFTQANGLLTPTLKVRRRAVMERFGAKVSG